MADFNISKNRVKEDAEAAVLEYDVYFLDAYAAAPDPWCQRFARTRDTEKLIARWPVDLSSPGFQKFRGTPRFRTLSEKFFDLEVGVFDDGVAEDARKVAAIDFLGFASQPQKMAIEAKRLPNKLAAAALGTGETFLCWDGTNFFATSGKPYNPLDLDIGTYRNYFTGLDLTETNVITVLQDLATRKAPNGESLGLIGTHILVPSSLFERARIIFTLPFGAGGAGATNTLFNRLEVVNCPELAPGAWYVLHEGVGLEPLAISTRNGGTPATEVFGVGSVMHQMEKKVGFNAELDMAVGLAMPWAITKVKIAP